MTLVEQLLTGAATYAWGAVLTEEQRRAVDEFLRWRQPVQLVPLVWGDESLEEWSDRMDRQAAACWA